MKRGWQHFCRHELLWSVCHVWKREWFFLLLLLFASAWNENYDVSSFLWSHPAVMKLQDMDEWDQYMTLSVKTLKCLIIKLRWVKQCSKKLQRGVRWNRKKKITSISDFFQMPTEFEGHWRPVCDFSPRKINF